MSKQIKWSKLRLKTVFNLTFIGCIVLPILIVLIGVLGILNRQFRTQAIENIARAQETIQTELNLDIETMSMRLSHLIHSNNNEVLTYAAGTDTIELEERNRYQNKLNQAGSLALEPVSDILSVGFYMKDGMASYYKNAINWPLAKIRQTGWYREALKSNNQVVVGWINTAYRNELYSGSRPDALLLVFALAPDRKIDRSEKIEMVTFYQLSRTGDKIKAYNKEYLNGKNKLGQMQIRAADGNIVFSTIADQEAIQSMQYTCVKTPVAFYETTWYIESYIPTMELTSEFWRVANYVLLVAVVMLVLVGYCSRYFLRSIVVPIEKINTGLRMVEEGELAIHLAPEGQYEIRTMIHSFNAMVRRLQALILEYEEKVKRVEKSTEAYFEELMSGSLTPKELQEKAKYFFEEEYALLGIKIRRTKGNELEKRDIQKMIQIFRRNPKFSAKCSTYVVDSSQLVVLYRMTEEMEEEKVVQMISVLQKTVKAELNISFDVCVGKRVLGADVFLQQVEEVRQKLLYRYLRGEQAVFSVAEAQIERIMKRIGDYEGFARALYAADERNILKEKERLFTCLTQEGNGQIEVAREQVLAAVLALAKQFEEAHADFYAVFGEIIPYEKKVTRITDVKSLKLWVTNYIDWLMDYEENKLGEKETDVIKKAKQYISNHYANPSLSLGEVADHVGLNEKYFTSKFSKETGESFMNYLTGLRMQKAKELLKTTTFKMYEVAEMVGYRNVENFTRVFKKQHAISPLQYRKTM